MSSYHLPIILGNNQSERIVIVHLIDDAEKYEENRVVITSTAGSSSTPLFRISDKAKLIDLEGNEVNPSFKKGDNYLEVRVNGHIIEPKKPSFIWLYRVPTAAFDGVVRFSVTIKEENVDKTYAGQLHIVRPAANQQVTRINADLGSDATQINYYIRGKGASRSEKLNLVQGFMNAYEPERKYSLIQPAINEPRFIQQEQGGNSFYKTGNITFHVKGNIDAPLKDSETFINYLNVSASGKNESVNSGKGIDTWDKEAGFDRKLINIKMLYAHGDRSEVREPVEDIVFYDNSSASFEPDERQYKSVSSQINLLRVLQSIYKQLIKVSTDQVAQHCKLFSVLLLVPNIYNQENIDLLLHEVNKLNKDSDRKYDFRIISESDSAFVGIKETDSEGATSTILGNVLNRAKKRKSNNSFLIIDSGKGTTDFSIIRYDSESSAAANSDMLSLRRGGIVGAGGAIDYVFARILARQIYKSIDWTRSEDSDTKSQIHPDNKSVRKDHIDMNEFVNRFMTMVEQLSPRDQDKMMLIVELLKKHYDNDKQGQMPSVHSCFNTEETKTIVTRLGSKKLDKSGFNFIIKDEEAWKNVSQWVWNRNYDAIDPIDKEEVDWVCSAIANTIINEKIFGDGSETKPVDYVVFSGRSFLFKPLLSAFTNVLNGKKKAALKKACPLFSKFKHDPFQILELDGIDMKAVSVQYEEHDLGVNCNSDLCCTDGFEFEGSEAIGSDHFCNGFSVINKGVKTTHYYIGYVAPDADANVADVTAHSFAPYLSQGVNMATSIGKVREQLIKMTLFPVKYESGVFSDTVHTFNPPSEGSGQKGQNDVGKITENPADDKNQKDENSL